METFKEKIDRLQRMVNKIPFKELSTERFEARKLYNTAALEKRSEKLNTASIIISMIEDRMLRGKNEI